jgi:mRNA-degrading endonuclease RelE of RelBE toxin-antitoxin system
MYKVEYSKEADKTLRKWKKSNPILFKKATKVLMDIIHLLLIQFVLVLWVLVFVVLKIILKVIEV